MALINKNNRDWAKAFRHPYKFKDFSTLETGDLVERTDGTFSIYLSIDWWKKNKKIIENWFPNSLGLYEPHSDLFISPNGGHSFNSGIKYLKVNAIENSRFKIAFTPVTIFPSIVVMDKLEKMDNKQVAQYIISLKNLIKNGTNI